MLEDNDDRGYGDDGDLVFIPRIMHCQDKLGNLNVSGWQ